ncbi:MAG: hypothetical protein C4321_03590 [Chloroflexota bacterium]
MHDAHDPPFIDDPAGNSRYSFAPLVIINPKQLLADRLMLDGARSFDQALRMHRGAASGSDFAVALPDLAKIASDSVSAKFTAPQALAVQTRWREVGLPERVEFDLDQHLPDDGFVKGINELVLGPQRVPRIGYAKLFKTFSLVTNTTMLDSWVRVALDGWSGDRPPRKQADRLAYYLSRFRILLQALGTQLDAIDPPDGFPYTRTDKLDRLLWLGWWGASFWPPLTSSLGLCHRLALGSGSWMASEPSGWASDAPCGSSLEDRPDSHRMAPKQG